MPATLQADTPFTLGNYPPQIQQAVLAVEACGVQDLVLPITFATANNAVLFTVPTGLRVQIEKVFWEVTTSWTGGSSSAIGLSSSNVAYNTAGDLLGGASGDVLATLVSTTASGFCGTTGTKLTTQGLVVLVAADTVKFNRITSAFTVGAGNVHLKVCVLPAN